MIRHGFVWLLVLLLLFQPVLAGYTTTYNPFTGRLDYVSNGNFSGGNITADGFYFPNGTAVGGGGGGSASPAGSDSYVQFNDGGSFGGSSNLTWNESSLSLSVGSDGSASDIRIRKGGSDTGTLDFYNNGISRGHVQLTSGENLELRTGVATTSINFVPEGDQVMVLSGASGDEAVLITPSSATDIGLTVQGAASQTVNLQEWQNSSGGTKLFVDESGNIGRGVTNPVKPIHLNTTRAEGAIRLESADYGFYFDITPSDTSSSYPSFRTNSNLIEFYTGASNLVQRYTNNADGNGYTNVGIYRGLFVRNEIHNAYPSMIIKQNTGQYADLTRWLDSSGSTLIAIDDSGYIATPSAVSLDTNANGVVDLSFATYNINSGWSLVQFNPTGGNGFVLSASDTMYLASDTDTGIGWSNADSFSIKAGGKDVMVVGDDAYDESVLIQPDAATDIGLTVQGATSQSANLQEWQNSAGTAVASISANGNLQINAANGVTASAVTVKGTSNFDTGQTSQVGVIVKGRAGQTANLQEWQNSAGNVLMSFNAGTPYLQIARDDGTQVAIVKASGASTSILEGDNTFRIETDTTTGKLLLGGQNGRSLLILDAGNDLVQLDPDDDGSYEMVVGAASSNQSVFITSEESDNIGLTVQGVTSQSANLTEWKNSTGDVLLAVQPTGNITMKSPDGSYWNCGVSNAGAFSCS